MVPVLLAMSVSAWSAGPGRALRDPARDVRQTIHARKLLSEDPELAAWNIGVTIQDRVATLWGPVPSAEVAFRAELCLRSVIELADVRNELVVSDALKPMRVPLKIDNPPSFLPDHLPPPLPKSPRSIIPPPGDGLKQDGRDPFRPRLIERIPALNRIE
jgi:hypothetical protein